MEMMVFLIVDHLESLQSIGVIQQGRGVVSPVLMKSASPENLLKRPFWWRGDPEMGDGRLLLVIDLNFLIPTSLHSSGSATITIGCLPMWNLKHKSKRENNEAPKLAQGSEEGRIIHKPEDWTIVLGKNTEHVWSMLCEQREVTNKRECRRSRHLPHTPIWCIEVRQEPYQQRRQSEEVFFPYRHFPIHANNNPVEDNLKKDSSVPYPPYCDSLLKVTCNYGEKLVCSATNI